jgi:hypothetical protein
MYGMGNEERFNPEVQIEAARLAQARQVDRFRQEARGQRPLDDDRAYGRPAKQATRLAGIVAVVIAAVAITWFYGGNTAGLIAGGVAAAMALALALRWWKLRP